MVIMKVNVMGILRQKKKFIYKMGHKNKSLRHLCTLTPMYMYLKFDNV